MASKKQPSATTSSTGSQPAAAAKPATAGSAKTKAIAKSAAPPAAKADAPAPQAAVAKAATATALAPGERRRLVAEAAYLRAKARGFIPGKEMEDWLAAEREIAARFGG